MPTLFIQQNFIEHLCFTSNDFVHGRLISEQNRKVFSKRQLTLKQEEMMSSTDKQDTPGITQ